MGSQLLCSRSTVTCHVIMFGSLDVMRSMCFTYTVIQCGIINLLLIDRVICVTQTQCLEPCSYVPDRHVLFVSQVLCVLMFSLLDERNATFIH